MAVSQTNDFLPRLLRSTGYERPELFKNFKTEETSAREYIRFELVDFHCKGLSKTVPGRHRNSKVYMYSGAMSTGANQEVLVVPEEVGSAGCPNSELLPDWTTLQVLPWACRPDRGIVVKRVYCEQALPGSQAPRTICRRMLKELRAWNSKELQMFVGGELEFVLAKQSGTPDKDGKTRWVPFFNGPEIFTTLQNCKAMDFCYDLERDMETVGVDIQTMNAEYGAGQVEITFSPKFGIDAADMTATFRTGVKEIAQNQGLLATFMAKPFGVHGVGNGGHLNFSLWTPDEVVDAVDGKTNVFHSSDDLDGLSATARSFLAGILAHAPALEAICSPTPPCYTRHGNWAPVVANWGLDDRSCCVRVKSNKDGPAGSSYMELRMPSAAANPYLVIASLVAAGLDGLDKKLELGPPKQTEAEGALVLPKSLGEALSALEADTYMVSKLGSDFVRWYTTVKRAEMAKIEDLLSETARSDDDVSSVWQRMFMEFV
eukprot:TRINITY_DN15773_c0_g1_i1.p1 TRINITY_DN15773_c0_g1~~TRINITY_DN15773_c0_g1_i1.p1  ORF type:complete len:488 (+),score=108.74 TRINITY_DN15773_c0_g1_i1:77-1540(+)